MIIIGAIWIVWTHHRGMQSFMKNEDKSLIDVEHIETTYFDYCAFFEALTSSLHIPCNLLHLPLWCVHCLSCRRYPSQHRYDFCAQIEFVVVASSFSFSFVYHRLILSTQSVRAMFWPMAQLRTGQLRMVVGSCWWCGHLYVLARHIHMLHCPTVPTSSWMLCTDRPKFAVCSESSSVFDSELLHWRLLLGPIRGDVSGGSGCFPLLLPRCRNPRILRPVLRDDT